MILALWLAACRPAPELVDLGPLPAFALTDQTGAAAAPADYAGQVWVVNFIFTSCPDVCPTLSAQMADIGVRYDRRDDLRLVSISVDPVTDTPPVLAAYGARFGAVAPRWRLLTGDADAVKEAVVGGFRTMLATAPATGTAPETVLHGNRFVVVDRAGHIRAFPDPKVPAEMYAVIDAVLAE